MNNLSAKPDPLFLSAEERFKKAVKICDKINRKNNTDEDLGKIYGLYKQSTIGDCDKKCPNMVTDYTGYKKWMCWSVFKGTDKTTAMNEYADAIIDMADKYGLVEAKK